MLRERSASWFVATFSVAEIIEEVTKIFKSRTIFGKSFPTIDHDIVEFLGTICRLWHSVPFFYLKEEFRFKTKTDS